MSIDIGVCYISENCPNLSHLEVNYCSGVSDKSLIALGQNSKELLHLNLAGCGKITDYGIEFLSKGCWKLKHLDLSACFRITDNSVISIANYLKRLEELFIRNCDSVTDDSIIYLSKSNEDLRVLDLSSLDYLTILSIDALAANCQKLTTLNADSCSFTTFQFTSATKNKLAFTQPHSASCKLIKREKQYLSFNNYYLFIKKCNFMACRLQKFCKCIIKNTFKKIARLFSSLHLTGTNQGSNSFSPFSSRATSKDLLKKYNSSIISQKVFRGYTGRKRAETIRKLNVADEMKAKKLQKALRRLFSIKYAKDKLRMLRIQDVSTRLIQRFYRGHRARKRTKKLFKRLYEKYRQLGIIFAKYQLIGFARILHRQIVKVQAHARRFPIRMKYKIAIHGIVLFQKVIKRLAVQKKSIFNLYTVNKLNQIRKNTCADKIKKFIRAKIFNHNMIPFLIYCARYYDNLYHIQQWSALRIQTQFRRYLAYNVRKNIISYRAKLSKAKIVMLIHFKSFLVRKRLKRSKFVVKAFKRFFIHRGRLILGIFTKKIQKLFRSYKFLSDRLKAASLIQRVGRGYLGRKIRKVKLYLLKIVACERILRYFRRFKGRMWRRTIRLREHMGAWKIQFNVRIRIINNFESKRRINLATQARLKREALDNKLELLRQKRIKVILINLPSFFFDKYLYIMIKFLL